MKKIIATIALGLALAFSTMLAAPAQAAGEVEPMRTGSYVTFNYRQLDIPQTIDFHVVKVSGDFRYLSWQETISNVKYVCPKSDDYRINYYRQGHQTAHFLDAGECLWPAFADWYYVGYYRAN